MARGHSWLQRQRERHLSRAVVYRRGAQTASVLATRAQSTFEITDATAALVKIEVRDEIIGVTQLKLSGVAVTPKAGDTITDGDYTVEVAPPVIGTPEWEWASPHRTAYRIHTKPVAGPGN